jgi:gliding motility-associated-like protein
MDTIQKPLWVFNEEQILVPSSFSPNQDGYNEEFTLYITGVKEYRMEVYNRWGEKIFDSEIEKKLSWDGTFAGKPCQQDVYVVLLYYTDRLNKRNMTKKTVQLLR